MTGDDTRDDDWQEVCERWAAQLRADAVTAQAAVADSTSLVEQLPPRAQQVAALLLAEDDGLHELLCNLYHRLQQWVLLDDHTTSAVTGKLPDHLALDRYLAAAVAGLVDLLERPADQGVPHE
jgi:hypothetical protein